MKTTDPDDPTRLLSLGTQRTDGAELNFQGNLTDRWSLYAGYGWLDGRINSPNTISNGVLLVGKRPQMTALHNGTVWSTYQFKDGFGFGGGVIAKSAQFPAPDNLAKLPGYAEVNASIFYRARKFEIQGNLRNLGNLRYYDAAQSDYQIYPAAPINGSVTVRYRF
jgi:catecholate siderophore receptor